MSKSRRTPAAKALKEETLRFRVSADEKQAISDAAGREALGVSAWLRQLALKAAGVLPASK